MVFICQGIVSKAQLQAPIVNCWILKVEHVGYASLFHHSPFYYLVPPDEVADRAQHALPVAGSIPWLFCNAATLTYHSLDRQDFVAVLHPSNI